MKLRLSDVAYEYFAVLQVAVDILKKFESVKEPIPVTSKTKEELSLSETITFFVRR